MRKFNDIAVHLLPFFISVLIYFIILPPNDEFVLSSIVLKCLPIVCLVYFVLTIGFQKGCVYPRRILIGLILGSIGNAVILQEDLFVFAIMVFSVGHIFYALAFGFLPLKPGLGLIILSVGVLQMLYLLPGLPALYIVPLTLYGIVISTMLWRDAVRSTVNLTIIRLVTLAGAILFVISDSMKAIDMFLHPIPFAQILIMSTYYLAQLGIALSVVEITY